MSAARFTASSLGATSRSSSERERGRISARAIGFSHMSLEKVTKVGPPGGTWASRNARRIVSGMDSGLRTSQVHCV
jgi:hypothetical protein